MSTDLDIPATIGALAEEHARLLQQLNGDVYREYPISLDRSVIMATYGRGNVYRRGRVWWVHYSVGGQQYRESSHSESKDDAIGLLNARLVLGGAKPVDRTTPTFELGATVIRHNYKANGRTSRIEKRLLHLEPFFGSADLSAIGAADVRSYQALRLKEAKPATINRELACLKRMCRLLHEDGVLRTVPPIRMLKENNVRTGFFEPDEIARLIDSLPEHLKPLVQFGYITGWRISEIVSRDFRHVGRTSVRLEPGETKNGRGREFPLIPCLQLLLDAQVERRCGLSRPLFFYPDGRRIKDFRGSWKRATKACGLDGMLFHDLRRTAIRNLIQSGIDRHTAKELTGHRTDSVFERYDIVDTPRLMRETMKLERFITEVSQTKERRSA